MTWLPLLFTLGVSVPYARQDTVPTDLEGLRDRVRTILSEGKVPGAGLALIVSDSVLWAGGVGLADVASGRPADENTLWRIGSTSKTFAAMAILRLVREGRLQLDTPIRDLVPEIKFSNRWEKTDPVRVVHLLEHTTGWDDLALRDYANSDSTPLSLKQGLDFNPTPRVCRWRPGTRFAYNNAGPAVAAYIAEKLMGHPFEELAWEWFFQPIGMHTATYLRTTRVVEQGATLYHADGVTPFPYWHILMRPAGAINASALDMAAYVRFLVNRGEVDSQVVVPQTDIERMEHPASWLGAKGGLRIGYGLHIYATPDSGFVWYGHDGGVAGGLTNMAYLPDYGIGYAVMINSGNGRAMRRIGHLVRRYLTRALPAPQLSPAARLAPEVTRDWSGWFRPDNPRRQDMYFLQRIVGLARVTTTDSSLTIRPLLGDEPETYLATGTNLLRSSHTQEPILAAVRDSADGRPVALEAATPGPSYHRIPAMLAWSEIGMAVCWLLGVAASLLFALIWVPRWLLGRLRGVGHLRVRAWPAAPALILLAWVGILAVTSEDPFRTLARPTVWSVGFFLLTLAFPLAALAGFRSAWRVPPDEIRPAIRWFALIVSGLNLIVSAYLLAFGVVGWRPWA